MKQEKFTVTGMTCAACQSHVQKAVSNLPGVQDCAVNLLSGTMTAQFDDGALSDAEICEAVKKAGYGAQPAGKNMAAQEKSARQRAAEELHAMKNRLVFSIIFFVPLLYISMGSMLGLPLPPFLTGMQNAITFGMAQLLLLLPILYLNRSYFINGYRTLFHRAPNMDSLIAIGATAAIWHLQKSTIWIYTLNQRAPS